LKKERVRERERKIRREKEREGEFKCFRETILGGKCCFEYVIKFWRKKGKTILVGDAFLSLFTLKHFYLKMTKLFMTHLNSLIRFFPQNNAFFFGLYVFKLWWIKT
jgi:hypothetical protein